MNSYSWSFAAALVMAGLVVPALGWAQAAPERNSGSTASAGLPSLDCGLTDCRLDYGASNAKGQSGASAAAADPTPFDAAPPPGQRLVWRGADYPACQSLGTGHNLDPANPNVGRTINDPYEYIKATAIPVPLGSTHADLLSTVSINLSGGPGGAFGTVGFLQLRRGGTATWVNVNTAYGFSIRGHPDPQSLWGKATYQGVVDLASLPDGSGIPGTVDVRMAYFNVFTFDGGFSNVNWNGVCHGLLRLTF